MQPPFLISVSCITSADGALPPSPVPALLKPQATFSINAQLPALLQTQPFLADPGEHIHGWSTSTARWMHRSSLRAGMIGAMRPINQRRTTLSITAQEPGPIHPRV